MSEFAPVLPPIYGKSFKPGAGFRLQEGSGTGVGVPLAHDNFQAPLRDVTRETKSLIAWPPNWNGLEVDAPNPLAISHAVLWIEDMYNDATRANKWLRPIVTADEDGDVAFEWWNGEKGLFVYISADEISYIIHWGENVETQMQTGDVTDRSMREHLWSWLID